MRVHIEIASQPDDRTCGATCLHAVYRQSGRSETIDDVAREIPQLPDGGTLAVQLGIHALERGFEATIYTYNVQLFDPTWFRPKVDLAERLRAQAAHKRSARMKSSTDAYLRFLELGGTVAHEELDTALLYRLIDRGPLLVGLSATYLYQSMRERPEDDEDDDVRGVPSGHFVLLEAYDESERRIWVADPWANNPMAEGKHYSIGYDRLAASILLSIVTYDANLLSITRREP